MTSDEQAKFYNQMIKSATEEARKHSKPSPETLKLINNMENQMIEIKGEIKSLDNSLRELSSKVPTRDEVIIAQGKEFEKTRCMIQDMFEKHEEHSDKKYAVKQVEDAVGEIKKDIKKLVWIIITAVVGALLLLVIKTQI
jgi:chromosome segregation ATPase